MSKMSSGRKDGEWTVSPMQVKTREAARLLRMSVRRLGALARSGSIPSYKCGATRYFRVESLSEWVDARMHNSSASRSRRSGSSVALAMRIAG
jgi:excisionase family DNA binding protein